MIKRIGAWSGPGGGTGRTEPLDDRGARGAGRVGAGRVGAGRAVAAGAFGSALVAVGALGVGALPAGASGWLGVDALRATAPARALSTGLAVAGVLLLLAAWLRLRGAGARTQLAAAALWAVPLLLAPPVLSRDVYAYAGQGALVHAGLDPYAAGPQQVPGPLADSVDPRYAGTPSPYGPVFLALAGRVVALTGQHVVPAVLLLRLLAVAGLVLAALALPRLAPDDPGRALWLGLANPLVLLHGVGGAHNDALLAGLLTAGLAARSRVWAAAALVTLAALVKVPAAAGLAVLLPARRGLRAPAVLTVTVAGTAALATAAAGLPPGWLRTSTAGLAGPDLLSPAYGLGRALQALGVPHGLALGKGAGTTLGLLAAAGLLLAAPRLGALRSLGLALVAVAALAPSAQPWYLLWGLLPLAAAGGARTTAGLAAASAVLCLALLPGGDPVLHGPTWGLPVLLAAAGAWLAARSGRIAR